LDREQSKANAIDPKRANSLILPRSLCSGPKKRSVKITGPSENVDQFGRSTGLTLEQVEVFAVVK
jgi:hypothetical protein